MTSPRSAIRRASEALRAIRPEILLVSDGAGWALDDVAHGVVDHLPPQRRATVLSWAPPWVAGRWVHFIDRYRAVEDRTAAHLARRNRVIVNWSHGGLHPTDSADLQAVAGRMREVAAHVDRVQVWSSLYVPIVADLGVAPERIVLLPLGLRTRDFPPNQGTTAEAKARLGLPPDSICVGSFQRDGEDEPKLVKGPDVLVELASRLARRSDRVVVLLTGPARGWVRQELAARGIPVRYFGVVPEAGRVRYYHACDVYAITSREEGGPISLLEAMSAGIPVVSTRVGMPADVVRHGVNGALVDVEDVDGLEREAARILWEPGVTGAYAGAALRTVADYDWNALGPRYALELYS